MSASQAGAAAGGPGASACGNWTGCHTFASDWQPGLVTDDYDGTQVGQITTGITSSPMYIILEYAISSTVGGPTNVPADIMIDDVRAGRSRMPIPCAVSGLERGSRDTPPEHETWWAARRGLARGRASIVCRHSPAGRSCAIAWR